MIREGKEIPETIKCWCGISSPYHHISNSTRKDGKKTVWYKCIRGHRTYHEIQEGRIKTKTNKRK